MLKFVILSIPCETLNGDKRNQGQILASPYHYKSTSLDSKGTSILSCMFYTEIWPAVWINCFTSVSLDQNKLEKRISLIFLPTRIWA